MQTYQKDPDGVSNYTINWAEWLDDATIATSSWAVDDDGLTIDTDTNTTTAATVYVSGGTAGVSYVLTNTITTATQTESSSILVYVVESFGAGPITSDDVTAYMTSAEANTYMAYNKLDKSVWDQASETEKNVALNLATKRIDRLAFKGTKAEDTQILKFPRSGDTSVPQAIKDACAEIAYQLIDGKNPEYEYEDLRVSSHKVGGVTITSNTGMIPPYKVAGIPSPEAWALLLPYLRDITSMPIERV